MELAEEIEFLIEAQKKHAIGPNKDKDFIEQVIKLYKSKTVSKLALDISMLMWPSKDKIVKKALALLEQMGNEDDDPKPKRTSGYRSSC
jgi:hypothetical protein